MKSKFPPPFFAHPSELFSLLVLSPKSPGGISSFLRTIVLGRGADKIYILNLPTLQSFQNIMGMNSSYSHSDCGFLTLPRVGPGSRTRCHHQTCNWLVNQSLGIYGAPTGYRASVCATGAWASQFTRLWLCGRMFLFEQSVFRKWTTGLQGAGSTLRLEGRFPV